MAAPTEAAGAVLKPSEPVADSAKQVSGVDFNQYAAKDITVAELVAGMSNMGFQASAVSEAVRIINQMVSLDRSGFAGIMTDFIHVA